MAEEEELIDWEVIESTYSGQPECEVDIGPGGWEVVMPIISSRICEHAPGKHVNDQHEASDTAMVNDASREQQTATDSKDDKQDSVEHSRKNTLEPCKSCKGFHYLPQCIYALTWTEWLDYHLTYMPSQSYGHSPEGLGEDTSDMQMLYYRAEELDDNAEDCEVNFLPDTCLKADLMTKSSVEMYLDDEEWQKRLSKC